MVRTAAYAYHKWGFESAYGGGVSPKPLVFGLEEKLSGLGQQNNQIALGALNQVNSALFAWLANAGRYSVEFVLSSPWFLQLFFDQYSVSAPSGGIYTHTFAFSKALTSISSEIGFAGETANVVRTLVGLIGRTASIRSSIGDLVRCSVDLQHGSANTIGTSLDNSPPTDSEQTPYSFVSGSLQLPNGTTIAQIQSLELTLNNNAELLYGHGSPNAVSAYRKSFEMTGRFNASMVDATLLQLVLNRQEVATLTLQFDNGLSSTSHKQISFNMTNVGVSEHNNPAIQPVDPVFQDLIWQIRAGDVTSLTSTATEP